MKRLLTAGFFFMVALGLTSSAHASLLGDLIFIEHRFPNTSTINISSSKTVVNGPSDTVVSFPWYDINPESHSILVDYKLSSTWSPAVFNGLFVSSIATPVTNVTIDTNLSGWDNSRLFWNNDSIAFNWESLPFSSNTYFNAELAFNTQTGGEPGTNAVPEPSSLALLASGLGLIGLKRKFA